MLTSKQRARLRAMANSLDTIYQVGKGGIEEKIIQGVSDALEARELIKLRVLDNAAYSAREAAEALAQATGADIVSVIGSRFVLYRASENNKMIIL